MTESQQDIARVAVGALVDLYERESTDLAAVKYLTLEVELHRGKPVAARSWTERGVNIGKLLADRGPT
jgi:hypothetical protein